MREVSAKYTFDLNHRQYIMDGQCKVSFCIYVTGDVSSVSRWPPLERKTSLSLTTTVESSHNTMLGILQHFLGVKNDDSPILIILFNNQKKEPLLGNENLFFD